MITDDERAYLLELAQKSVLGTPSEYDAYGVVTEAFILHKKPMRRYTIFPQLFLSWKPDARNDKRGVLPDFGIGYYYDSPPHVRLQGGAEVKAAMPFMDSLPPPANISNLPDVKDVLYSCFNQAEDQAKAAVKGGLLPANQPISWLMFIGPYFTKINLPPFTTAQLQTRGHKANASGDFKETLIIELRKSRPRTAFPLFLLGTVEAANEIENFLTSTSGFL
jgi:hypothetical protein